MVRDVIGAPKRRVLQKCSAAAVEATPAQQSSPARKAANALSLPVCVPVRRQTRLQRERREREEKSGVQKCRQGMQMEEEKRRVREKRKIREVRGDGELTQPKC